MAQSAAVTLGGPKIIVSRALTQADKSTTPVVAELPAKCWVPPFGVTVYVAELCSGGTPSIDVGDSNIDVWVDTTDVTEGTVGCYTGDGGDAAYSTTGHYYSTATNLIATVGDGSLADGTVYVFTTYYDFSNRDLAAS
jgi:hypothetical protein